tara:strand:- start:404 stop:583 length:180 start_codon:yes stop_codon:yes gene_type:complete
MKVQGIPADVDQMLVLGNDKDYLVVYTYLSNETAIELLERALEVLRHEQELNSQTLTKH